MLKSSQVLVTEDVKNRHKRQRDVGGLHLSKVSLNGIMLGEMRRSSSGALYFHAENGNVVKFIDEEGKVPPQIVGEFAGVSAINDLSGNVTFRLRDIFDIDSIGIPVNGDTILYDEDLSTWVFGKSSDKNFVHIQTVPSQLWTAQHYLNKLPNVEVYLLGVGGVRQRAIPLIELPESGNGNEFNFAYAKWNKPKTGIMVCN